jgi:hypothetical protein
MAYLDKFPIKEIANDLNTTEAKIKCVLKDTAANVFSANTRFGVYILIVYLVLNSIPYVLMVSFFPTFNIRLFYLICFTFSWLVGILLKKPFQQLAKLAGQQYAAARYFNA